MTVNRTALRSLAYHSAFYVWSVILGIATLPALLVPRPIALCVGRLWVNGVFRLLAGTVGLTYEVRGEGHRPSGPAIYAIKHQSAWDTLVLPRLFADPAIILKRELVHLPIFGWYLRRLGMIAIDRKAGAAALRAMLATARARIENGRDIIVFPEGTRTPPGTKRAYHPGIAALYRDLEVPVIPVALNSGLYWGRREFAKRPGCIVVSFLPPIERGLDRKTFMKRLESAIEAETQRLLD